MIAGASLSVDYILTVAVSISSGTAAITSAFPVLYPFTVPICLVILVLIMLGNLRGIRDSSKLFSIPAYAFIISMLITIGVGIVKYLMGYSPAIDESRNLPINQPVTVMLMLSAFSNGCAALTGVEAVSNAIPNFREPQVKNAQRVLMLLSFFVLILFGGVTVLANLYHPVIKLGNTVLSQITYGVYGNTFMYYVVQVTTATILVMAANTSYSDFPLLMSLISKEGFAPRQLAQRGDRLSFSNGIIVLSSIAALLIVVFRGNTSLLIPLYAVGVFVSFTLSQFGMLKHWLRRREGSWKHKAVINGLGALVTSVVVVILSVTKFKEGAWIVILVVPTLVLIMMKIKKHYNAVAKQLKVGPKELEETDVDHATYKNRVIVPIASINKASIRALKYANTISDHVTAFSVTIDEESGEKLRNKYDTLHTNIPLVIKYSPYRKIVDPLLEYIDSEEYNYKKGDMITVILPEFQVRKWWQRILHNGSGRYIEKRLLKYKHIVVATMPLQLKDEALLFKNG